MDHYNEQHRHIPDRPELDRPRMVRGGFTLLELLIVISLIALILSAFVAVLANYVGASREAATRATIQKIDRILKQRMDAFRKQDFTDAATRLLQTGQVSNLATGKALIFKEQFRLTFPQQAEDTSRPPFDRISSLTTQSARSSAYLYAIITDGPTFGTPTVDESAFLSSETRTENGVTYFIDSWGEPLRYYRSATRLFWLGNDVNANGSLDTGEDDVYGDGSVTPISEVHPPPASEDGVMDLARKILASGVRFTNAGSQTHPLRIDPDDRLNRLRVLLGSPTSTPPLSQRWRDFETRHQTPGTYSAPLIVSGGPDRRNGLKEPDSSLGRDRRANVDELNDGTSGLTNFDLEVLTDNITNLNIRAGGTN